MTFSEVIIKRMNGLIETANKNSAWEMEAAAEMMKAVHLLTLVADHGLAQDAPSGWKLVPIEPTDAMVEVGCDNNPTQWNEGTDNGFAVDVANDVYVSMVRSAPAAPQQSPRLEREVVARIIDPDGFSGLETERAWAAQWKKSDDFWLPWQKRCDKALEKSDAILALLSPDTTVGVID